MVSKSSLPPCNLPEDGLRFFHRLSNWVEQSKTSPSKYLNWNDGQKQIKLLKCLKPKQKEPFVIPEHIEKNTLCLPAYGSGIWVIKQLRHAFCHDNLMYDAKTEEYEIKRTRKVGIAGKFTLNALEEFVDVYLQPKKQKIKKNE